MSDKELFENEKQNESLRREVCSFAGAFCKHWTWWIGSTVISAILAVYQGGGGTIPNWALWLWAGGGAVIAFFLTWRDEKRRAKKAEYEKNELLKKQRPLFKLTCNSSLPECKVSTTQDYYRPINKNGLVVSEKFLSRPAVWFRMIVEVECSTSLEKCTGYITKIEKESEILPIPEKFQVTFCSGMESDTFAKTISKGIPEYLDLLSWEQDVGIKIPAKVIPNSINLQSLFAEKTDYILTVVVTGGSEVAPKEAKLKFHWTGKIDTTEMLLI